jgi:hypothetical protein
VPFSNFWNCFGSGMHVETIEIDDEFKCGPTKIGDISLDFSPP